MADPAIGYRLLAWDRADGAASVAEITQALRTGMRLAEHEERYNEHIIGSELY